MVALVFEASVIFRLGAIFGGFDVGWVGVGCLVAFVSVGLGGLCIVETRGLRTLNRGNVHE